MLTRHRFWRCCRPNVWGLKFSLFELFMKGSIFLFVRLLVGWSLKCIKQSPLPSYQGYATVCVLAPGCLTHFTTVTRAIVVRDTYLPCIIGDHINRRRSNLLGSQKKTITTNCLGIVLVTVWWTKTESVHVSGVVTQTWYGSSCLINKLCDQILRED